MSFNISQETQKILDSVPSLVKKTFPIPARFRSSLPSQIAELSRLLTSGRGDRSLSYLSRPNFLSAYLHYFFPWNLCRLCLLLPELRHVFHAGDTIADLGSGPLTFACALWISRPDLRTLPLEFTCIDRCAPALEAGKKMFAAIGGGSPWTIHTVRGEINIRTVNVNRKQKPAALVCAVNLFNEIYENLPHSNNAALRQTAVNSARLMHSFASPSASILTVEPGVPQSGRFIAFLRDAFIKLDRPPVSPCTHAADCPTLDAKKRWCHFAFDTSNLNAQTDLHRLSAAAGIPKERLVFSFLLAGSKAAGETSEKARVISDAFPLPSDHSRARFGRYSCCAQGLVLLTGEKSRIEKIDSGSLVTPVFSGDKNRDAKSGALIAEVK